MQRTGGGSRDRDRGQTFVEILVSIVLLGTAVGGTLTALRTTIVSSQHDDEKTKANVWLLAVEDALYREPYHSCFDPGPGFDTLVGMDEGDILHEYETAINAAPPPAGWATATVRIRELEFWQKSDGTPVWVSNCPTDPLAGRSAQLVTVDLLRSPGDVVNTIQVVKDGG
jgi:hypothetical protein